MLPPPSQPLQPRLTLVLPLTLYLLLALSELLRDEETEKTDSDPCEGSEGRKGNQWEHAMWYAVSPKR